MDKKLKNISQSTDIYEIVRAIEEINPNVKVKIGKMFLDSEASNKFYSSVPIEKLKLPSGFYINERNEITNKHNTKTGLYCSLAVEDLSLVDKSILTNKRLRIISQSTDIYEITEAIQEINPHAEVRIGKMYLDSEASNKFYSSVPIEKLRLPIGFYINERNEITNKHKTQTGLYCSLAVEDLSLVDKSMLMPKAEKVVERTIPRFEEQKQQAKEAIIKALQNLKSKIINKEVGSNVKSR